MPTVLDEIVANKRLEVAQRKSVISLSQMQGMVEEAPSRRFEKALYIPPEGENGQAIRLILEVKPASPSAGVLAKTLDLDALLENYNLYGSALSVLTDQTYFKGSLDLLLEVLNRTHLPALCKDFILDPYQIVEARLAGADAVLLIVKILDDAMLKELHETADVLGMTAVVEIQNEQELERALAVNPSVLLINNRDLGTFNIDLETTARLVPRVPAGVLCISASGIESRQDIETLMPVCRRFLIGSTLMKMPLPQLAAKLKELYGV